MGLNSIVKIVLFLFFITTNFVAQKKSNNLKAIWENPKNADAVRFKALNEYYENNTTKQPNIVIPTAVFHYNLAKQKNNKEEMVNALKEESIAYWAKTNAPNAIESIEKAIKIQKTLKDRLKLASLYLQLGNVYNMQNKYVETLKYYNYALKIFKDTKQEIKECVVLSNIGLAYLELQHYDLAMSYFEKALKISKKHKSNKIANINLYMSDIYLEKKEYKKAIELTESALKIFQENNDIMGSADCYASLAQTYQKINKKDKAIVFLNKSLELNLKLDNTFFILSNKIFLAELYLDTDANKATQIAEEALAMLDSEMPFEIKSYLYKTLYKCYKKTNKADLSLEMYEKYLVCNDSVIKEQSNLALMKEGVNQEFKIELSKTKNSFQESENVLKRNQFIKLALVILISLLIVFTIYFFARKKNIANKKEREALIEEIENLKKTSLLSSNETSEVFELNRINVEKTIKRKLNETDWTVLSILSDNPVIANKEIAQKAFMSVDGIGSSLRRMYEYFEIGESKYKKTDLIRKAILISTNT